MNKIASWAALIALASCEPVSSSVPEPLSPRIRVAIADLESKEGAGGKPLADSVREHLQDELFACRRFEILERQRVSLALEELKGQSMAKLGAMTGADWIVYGVITPESGGAHVHLRVIRVTTGVILYTGSRPVGLSDPSSVNRGARSAAEELAREISILPN